MIAEHEASRNPEPIDATQTPRQRLMAACAVADTAELTNIIDAFQALVDTNTIVDVRPPELGLVMLRGRMGGDGAAFNVGEATVARAVVRLKTGAVGYAYQLGRSKERARLAAIVDAIGQSSPNAMAQLQSSFVEPVMQRAATQSQSAQAEADATRVNFFTMTRGED